MTVDVIEGNKLIAEFMGLYRENNPNPFKTPGNEAFTHSKGFYHCYWDWLMPVVEKIRNINWDERKKDTTERELSLIKAKGWLADHSILYCGLSDIWEAVIQFITWYNSQPKTNQP